MGKKRRRIVMDTNVLLAALRSRKGASFRLLSLVGSERFDISLSVPLLLEYEEIAQRCEWSGKPSKKVIDDILDYLCLVGNRKKIHFLWRPQESDPNDDMVLEVAVAGMCDCIVTFNKKDFVQASRFGIDVLTPAEFLKSIGEIK